MKKLNSKLILNPKSALEELRAVTAALYTGISPKTANPKERDHIINLCTEMWDICDSLALLAGGE